MLECIKVQSIGSEGDGSKLLIVPVQLQQKPAPSLLKKTKSTPTK